MGLLGKGDDLVEAILDMSRKARMKRAAEQGFDTDTVLYHGTMKDFPAFSKTDDGVELNFGDAQSEMGHFFTNNPKYASRYAVPAYNGQRGAPNVMPVYSRLRNPKHLEQSEIDLMEDWDADAAYEWVQGLKSSGYDGIVTRDFYGTMGKANEVIVFDPSNIRSVNAAFDPAKKDSSNLLASMAGAGILGGGLYSEDADASIIGTGAKVWPEFMESIARKMRGEGIDPKEIWQKTGIDLDAPDGLPRSEIDDSGARLFGEDVEQLVNEAVDAGDYEKLTELSSLFAKAPHKKARKLGGALDHDGLYSSYPDIKGVKYTSKKGKFDGGYSGTYMPSSDAIAVADSPAHIKRSNTLHETQHAIQAREGFEGGASATVASTDALDAVRARLTELESAGDFSSAEYKGLLREKMELIASTDSRDLYHRSAGETEARNVQTRLNMTPQERRATPLWETEDVPRSEQIVRQSGQATPSILGATAGAGVVGGSLYSEDADAGPLQAGAKRLLDDRFLGALGGSAPRVALKDTVAGMETGILPRNMDYGESLSLYDLEGHPYILTQSDRSAAGGEIISVHGTSIDPVDLRGGRDFMFDEPSAGQVWASDPNVVKGLYRRAGDLSKEYGKDTILLPYSMAPTGIDFATMPLETMIAYAREGMGGGNIKKLDRAIKKIIPEWKGVADPNAVQVFRDVKGPKRKAVADLIDKKFRDVPGGMSISEARAATTDSAQYLSPEGQVVNVGRIDSGRPIIEDSGHPTYLGGLPGEGMGRLTSPVDVRPFLAHNGRNITGDAADIRSLSMNHGLSQGVIDEELLGRIYGTKQSGQATPSLLGTLSAGSLAAAAAPQARAPEKGFGDTLLEALQGATRAWGSAGGAIAGGIEAIDYPLRSALAGGRLVSGLGSEQAQRDAYGILGRESEETLFDWGAAAQDAVKDTPLEKAGALLGTGIYSLPQVLWPF